MPPAESSFSDMPPPSDEDMARYPASRGMPPSPSDAAERPATGETTATPFGRYGTQVMAQAGGKLPRVISGNERAPAGLKRWKVRADIPGEAFAALYLLGKEGDEEGVKKLYAAEVGLDKRRKVIDDKGEIKEVTRPYDLVVVLLPD